MKILKIILVLFLPLYLTHCASTSKTTQSRQISSNQTSKVETDGKAYSHYLEGALYDFQNQYEKALIEYYQALLYDSTSAQILKAIARDLMRLQRYDSAVEYLKKSYKLNPEDPETLNFLGEAYYNDKKYKKSLHYYKQLFKLDPYNQSVQNNLVFLYSNLKMDNQLLNFYKKLTTLYPGSSKHTIQYAMALLKRKKVDKAQNLLEQVVKAETTPSQNMEETNDVDLTKEELRNFSNLNILYVLGTLHETKKDTAKAIDIYKLILDENPQFEDALTRLFRIYRSRGNWDAIGNIYQPIISQDTSNSRARLILSEAYFYQEKMDSARMVLEPVMEDNKFRTSALELLGRIAFEENSLDEAENYFSLLTNENPKNKFSWIFLTLINNRQNQYNESIHILENALVHHQKDPDLLSLYGSTLSEMGKDKKAIEPLEKAHKLNPKDVNTIASLAAVYDKLKMWEKSDSLYESYLEKDSDNALLLNNYSYSLTERDVQLDKALNMAKKALKIDPKNGAYLDTMGWIYFKLGKYDKARQYIQQALDSREESAEVIEHMGDVYFKLNQLDKARQYWEKALEKDPENGDIKQKIQNL